MYLKLLLHIPVISACLTNTKLNEFYSMKSLFSLQYKRRQITCKNAEMTEFKERDKKLKMTVISNWSKFGEDRAPPATLRFENKVFTGWWRCLAESLIFLKYCGDVSDREKRNESIATDYFKTSLGTSEPLFKAFWNVTETWDGMHRVTENERGRNNLIQKMKSREQTDLRRFLKQNSLLRFWQNAFNVVIPFHVKRDNDA